MVIEAEENEEEKKLREYRERVLAMVAPTGQDFKGVYEGQNDLDAQFDAFMDEEYNEDMIGELDEDVGGQDQVNQKIFNSAVPNLLLAPP